MSEELSKLKASRWDSSPFLPLLPPAADILLNCGTTQTKLKQKTRQKPTKNWTWTKKITEHLCTLTMVSSIPRKRVHHHLWKKSHTVRSPRSGRLDRRPSCIVGGNDGEGLLVQVFGFLSQHLQSALFSRPEYNKHAVKTLLVRSLRILHCFIRKWE